MSLNRIIIVEEINIVYLETPKIRMFLNTSFSDTICKSFLLTFIIWTWYNQNYKNYRFCFEQNGSYSLEDAFSFELSTECNQTIPITN